MTADDPLVVELRQRRIERGLAKSTLSRSLHYNRNTVGRWEAGTRNPSAEARKAWAAALDYDPADDVDEGQVYLAVRGERVTLTKREREIVVARLSRTGMVAKEIARIVGTSQRQVYRDRYPTVRKEAAPPVVSVHSVPTTEGTAT